MGSLPETSRGNKHILVVIDHFTKWHEAFSTPDQKPSKVSPILINRIFLDLYHQLYSIPIKGESNLLQMYEIYDVMGIIKNKTTACHPQCDNTEIVATISWWLTWAYFFFLIFLSKTMMTKDWSPNEGAFTLLLYRKCFPGRFNVLQTTKVAETLCLSLTLTP